MTPTALYKWYLSNFKTLYTKSLFQRCSEVKNETKLSLKKFWKNYYNFHHYLRIINKTWGKLFLRSMNSAWKNLWPECVATRNFEGFEEPLIVPDNVSLGRSMHFEVSKDDIEEFFDEQRTKLRTEVFSASKNCSRYNWKTKFLQETNNDTV